PRYTVYTQWQKRSIVVGAAVCAFFNPLTAQVYLPALNVLSKEFNVTPADINLTVTTYMVFQGLTPTLFGGFTDTFGRRPGYIVCFVVYIAANIALALADRYRQLLIVRCLQSAGSATVMVLCQAVVADIITSAERGQYIGITAIPSILGPSMGPVIGGALTKFLGWRSIFWFLTICAGVNFALLLCFLPETCRKVVGDGSIRPPPMYRTLVQTIRYRRHPEGVAEQNMESLEKHPDEMQNVSKWKFATRHLFASVVLLRDVEFLFLLLCGGIVFSGVYAIGTAMPHQFATLYGFDDLEVGLMYLPLVGGSIVAVVVVGPGMNWNYRRHARRLGFPIDRRRRMDLHGFPIEKVRLQVALPLLALGAAVVASWGWVTVNEVEIEKVCIIVFFIGVSLVGVNNAINALIVDIFPEKAGAALAAYNLVKCLMGAVASGVIDLLIAAVGLGKAFTVFGALYLLLIPIMVLVMWRGVDWREQRRERE
ncbi:major facilitator superfamily domain-containing protein, partial [Bombardia bombarda]